MSRIFQIALGLLLAGIAASPLRADDDDRNCPKVFDQFVYVQPGIVSAFRLHVQNADASQVSIFQYPLGGILEPTGPTPLDFVFVPEADFGGTTTFTYRVQTPVGCGSRSILGHVTLAGGVADGTAAEMPVPSQTGGACGLGYLGMVSAFFGCFVMRRSVR